MGVRTVAAFHIFFMKQGQYQVVFGPPGFARQEVGAPKKGHFNSFQFIFVHFMPFYAFCMSPLDVLNASWRAFQDQRLRKRRLMRRCWITSEDFQQRMMQESSVDLHEGPK